MTHKNNKHFQVLPGIAVIAYDYQHEGIWRTAAEIEVKREGDPRIIRIPQAPRFKAINTDPATHNILDATVEVTEVDARILVTEQFMRFLDQAS